MNRRPRGAMGQLEVGDRVWPTRAMRGVAERAVGTIVKVRTIAHLVVRWDGVARALYHRRHEVEIAGG
jgi:hypothetical protein